MSKAWDKRLYNVYVSSGQASITNKNVESYLARRQAYIHRVIKQYIPANRDHRILDLGCGYGAYLYFLEHEGYENLDGIDASPEQVAEAHNLGLLMVKNQDMDSYLKTLDHGSVDVVLLMDVLEHLPHQQLFDVLDEVYRVLADGGKCIVHVPNGAGLFSMGVRYGDLTHERAFTQRSLQQLFNTIGFAEVRCFEDKPVVHGPVSAIRRLVWDLGTLPFKILLAAESGSTSFVLSQNMLATAVKPNPKA